MVIVLIWHCFWCRRDCEVPLQPAARSNLNSEVTDTISVMNRLTSPRLLKRTFCPVRHYALLPTTYSNRLIRLVDHFALTRTYIALFSIRSSNCGWVISLPEWDNQLPSLYTLVPSELVSRVFNFSFRPVIPSPIPSALSFRSLHSENHFFINPFPSNHLLQ